MNINARATLISLLLCFAVASQAQAEEYYIYQDPNGKLVISNKEPPPGSKIIKRHNWPEATDNEAAQSQQPANPHSTGQSEDAPKPSKSK